MTNAWSLLTDDAIAAFQAADDSAQNAFTYAWAASAIAQRQTWVEAGPYLEKVRSLALRDASGVLKGWSTTATGTGIWLITLADHVGPVLLEAYLADMATSAEVLDVARLIMATPRNNIAATGWGISFRADQVSATNVYNCTAAASGFLLAVHNAGLFVPDVNGAGSSTLAMQLGRSVTDAYQKGSGVAHNWVYSSVDATPTDADHESMMVEMTRLFAPAVSTHALDWVMGTNYGTQPNAALGHLRAGLFALDRIGTWLTEIQAYLAAQSTSAQRCSQVARLAARVGVAVG